MSPTVCTPSHPALAQVKDGPFLNGVEARKKCWGPLGFIKQTV